MLFGIVVGLVKILVGIWLVVVGIVLNKYRYCLIRFVFLNVV